jgi:hypothetical protein
MREKNNLTFTEADIIIVKHFGSKVADYYGDKFDAINEYIKLIDSDEDMIDEKIIAEFSERTVLKLKPVIDEMIEKNIQRHAAAKLIKDQVEKNNPDKAKTILSKLAGIDYRFKKFLQENIVSGIDEILSWKNFPVLSSPEGLIPVFAEATRGKPKDIITFSFQTESESYNGKIIKTDSLIMIHLGCSDENKEFFLSGADCTLLKKAEKGIVEFEGLQEGEYILSCEGKDFMVINISE